MLKVRDLMTPDPFTVGPEETLREAAEALAMEGIAGAPVVTGGKQVVGVVSLADILGWEAESPGVPTFRPELVDPVGDDVEGTDPEALEEEEHLRWFVEMWEDAGADVVTRMNTVESPEWDVLDDHTVEEVMTRRLLSVGPDDGLQEVARCMERSRAHRLLVMDGDELVGIVTAWDVVRGVAQGVVEAAEC